MYTPVSAAPLSAATTILWKESVCVLCCFDFRVSSLSCTLHMTVHVCQNAYTCTCLALVAKLSSPFYFLRVQRSTNQSQGEEEATCRLSWSLQVLIQLRVYTCTYNVHVDQLFFFEISSAKLPLMYMYMHLHVHVCSGGTLPPQPPLEVHTEFKE